MADEDGRKRKSAALRHNILLFAMSMTAILGLGWGGMALFGYYWVIVDFAAAPGWLVFAAFVAMPILGLVLGSVVGDGSVMEVGIKTVIMVAAGWLASGRYVWLDPFLLAVTCGIAAMLVVGAASRALGLEEMPDEDAEESPPIPTDQDVSK